MSAEASRRRVPRDAVLVLGGWILVALFRAGPRLLLDAPPWRPSTDPAEVLLGPLAAALAWAALTPLVARVCRRLPAGEAPPAQIVAVHALLAIPFLVVHGFLAFAPLSSLRLLTLDAREIAWQTWLHLWLAAPRQLAHYVGLVGVVTYVQALRRTRRAARREARLAAELTEAELDGLRARLSPEFFFRALDGALERVKERPGDAEEMLVALGELLRRATGRQGFTTLAAEREALDAYARVETSLGELATSLAPDTLDLEVPSGLLPRLVEEALPAGRGGRLELRAQREGGALRIVIEISDPGEDRERPLPDLRRLTRLYGEECALAVSATPRLTISARLPARRAREEARPAPFGVRRFA